MYGCYIKSIIIIIIITIIIIIIIIIHRSNSKKGCLLNCCIVHCTLLHTQTAMHHGCNEVLNSIAGAYNEIATFVY